MRSGRFDNEHVLAFEPGEKVLETLSAYLAKNAITAARFVAIGGLKRFQLRYFNTATMQYEHRDFEEQVEVDSLIGNVAEYEGKPYIHAHIVVSTANYHSYTGHLGEGIVEPTLEVFLTQLDGTLIREKDSRTGLGVLHPERGA
jgi:predicted DNA-binding protein with PD1-like motif